MMNLAADFEFHVAVNDHHNLVGVVFEVLPSLARWIGPDSEAEAPLRPI